MRMTVMVLIISRSQLIMLNRADTKFSLFLLVREVSLRPGLLSKFFRYLGMAQGYQLYHCTGLTITQTLKTFFENVLLEHGGLPFTLCPPHSP